MNNLAVVAIAWLLYLAQVLTETFRKAKTV